MQERIRFSPSEAAIIREEVQAGVGWADRAAARIPSRTVGSIRTYASNHGFQKSAGLQRGRGVHGGAGSARRQMDELPPVPEPMRTTRGSASNVPDFLRDDFAKWGIT
jgi:hypothetical protein